MKMKMKVGVLVFDCSTELISHLLIFVFVSFITNIKVTNLKEIAGKSASVHVNVPSGAPWCQNLLPGGATIALQSFLIRRHSNSSNSNEGTCVVR